MSMSHTARHWPDGELSEYNQGYADCSAGVMRSRFAGAALIEGSAEMALHAAYLDGYFQALAEQQAAQQRH